MTQVFAAETPARRRGIGIRAPKLDPIAVTTDPYPFLMDMRLEPDITNGLRPIVEQTGFRIEDNVVSDVASGDEHRFTCFSSGSAKRMLLQIPSEVLTAYTRITRKALNDVLGLILDQFNSAHIYIIYERVHLGQRINLLEWAKKQSFKLEFIELLGFDDLETLPSIAAKAALLTSSFSLVVSEEEEDLKKKPIANLSMDEKDKLANIIEGLASFSDSAAARRQFVERAGLEEAVGDLNYDSAPGLVAWEITKRVQQRGQIRVDGDFRHALRMLLDRLLAMGELGGAARDFVAGIIENYDFS